MSSSTQELTTNPAANPWRLLEMGLVTATANFELAIKRATRELQHNEGLLLKAFINEYELKGGHPVEYRLKDETHYLIVSCDNRADLPQELLTFLAKSPTLAHNNRIKLKVLTKTEFFLQG